MTSKEEEEDVFKRGGQTESLSLKLDKCPRFIILGAQKSGTTALYAYICDHPNVVSARRKETHFFDWRWKEANETNLDWTLVNRVFNESNSSVQEDKYFEKAIMGATKPGELFGNLKSSSSEKEIKKKSTEEELRIKYRLMYPVRLLLRSRKMHQKQRILVSGEATPSYLLYGETVARRVKAVAPYAKLIVAVRDPVARAYSQYQMTVDPVGSEFVKRIRGTYVIGDKTFQDVVSDDMKLLKRSGLETSSYDETCLDNLQKKYYDALPLEHGAHSYLGRGLYAAQIMLWLRHFPRDQIRVVCIDGMRDPDGCRKEMLDVYRYLGLSSHTLSDAATRPRNTKESRRRTYGPMKDSVRKDLESFFAPHNQLLYKLCGRDFGWGKKKS